MGVAHLSAGSEHAEWHVLGRLTIKGVAVWGIFVLLAVLRLLLRQLLNTPFVRKQYKSVKSAIELEHHKSAQSRLDLGRSRGQHHHHHHHLHRRHHHHRSLGRHQSSSGRSPGLTPSTNEDSDSSHGFAADRSNTAQVSLQSSYGSIGQSKIGSGASAFYEHDVDSRRFSRRHSQRSHNPRSVAHGHHHRIRNNTFRALLHPSSNSKESFWRRFRLQTLQILLETARFCAGQRRHFVKWFTFRLELAFNVTHVALSSVVCCLYVYESYEGRIYLSLYIVHVMCAIFFTAYTVLNWHVSERPLTHLLTLEVFLEVFTLPSLFLCTGERWLNFNFLFAFFILSKFVRFDEEIVLFRQKPLVLRLSMRLALRFFAFLFIASCGIQLLELIGDSTRSDSEVYELTWVNAFYFAVITLMTVGYGDFVAYTILGRLWVVVNALLAAYLVTRSIGLLVDNLARRPRGESSLLMFGDSDHVILCGSVKWEQLLQFVKEFYRGSDNYFTKVVVLCPDGPWSDEKWRKQVSRNETFRNNVVYIDGSVYEDRDMERSRADCARAFFVFATLREKDDSREDSNNLKRILAIREYSSNVPIYALNAHPESSFQFRFAMQPTNTDEEDDFNMRRSTLSILGRSRSSIFGQRSSQPSIWGLDGQRARRSTSMCLREVEMTLFTENIFCNGFSSLVTNLVCHSESSVSINDKPWMVEYKIGAACRLQSAQLPAGLWGRTTGEIAMSLYDCGLILLAVRSAETWKILEPSMTIPKRSTGMFISYLSGESLVKAVDCTSGFWGASDGSGSSSSDNLFSSSSEDDSSTTANSISTTISFGGFQSDGESHSSGEAGMKKRRSSFDSLILRKVLHSDSHRNSGPSTPRSRAPERKDRGLEPRSRHIGFDLSKGLSLAGVNKRADNSKKGRKLKVHSRFEELPVRLKEHILICFNESRGLGTLELLLGRIWTLAKRRGSGKVPVVVINEHFPPKFESRFARHSRDLFLVRGNGQSLDSLRQAQLQKAMAVIISSPDVNPGDLDSAADSSVMFTIMTLDFLLGENSDTFVCGFIGSEESMEVFPAPNHARRRRKALGLKTDSAAVPVDAQSGEPGSQVGGRSSLALHRTSSVPERMDRASAPLIMQSMTLPNLRALFAPPEGDEASPLRLGLPPRNRERFLDLSEFLSESDEEEHFERRDFRAKTGVKEEGVERQRYASGELMIPWLASAAIVREFNEPGFAKLLEDLIGCGQKDSSWIQLVRVAPNCAGRTYRAVMETLLAHGVIAIGLYRCVDAPVRLNDSQELSVSGSSRASARRSDGLNLSLGETAYLLAGSPMISNETCYTCPTTKGKYFFHTPVGGENKLPYVYTNPQPFTLVSDRDAVYCIANPSIDLPDEW